MTCECMCHTNAFAACTVPGGCGHLHRDTPLVDPFAERRRENRAAINQAAHHRAERHAEPPSPASESDVPQPRSAPPEGACLTHRPPKPDRPWCRADPGFRTCSACYDRLHGWLSPIAVDDDGRPDSIPGLYAILDARLGITEQGRRGPGFATRSPASDWVIAMRDPRSTRLTSGDPHSVPGVLAAWCGLIVEERGVIPPGRSVPSLARFLDAHLDWVSRQDWVDELHGELRELHAQLRVATGGGGQPPVGRCIEPVEGGECGAPIYMPRGEKPRAPDEPITDLPELRCPACDSRYTGRRLILLKLSSEKRTA